MVLFMAVVEVSFLVPRTVTFSVWRFGREISTFEGEHDYYPEVKLILTSSLGSKEAQCPSFQGQICAVGGYQISD